MSVEVAELGELPLMGKQGSALYNKQPSKQKAFLLPFLQA